MITREEAIKLLHDQGVSDSLLHHSFASEAVLAALAARLGQDVKLWAMTGLLHDIDYPKTMARPEAHGILGAELLDGQLPEEALAAIRSHNGEMNGVAPGNLLDYALRCGETVTGLIAAAALMRPTRYEGMAVKSIKKKMKDKAFAASVNRANIRECEKAGLELDEFLDIAISAMAEQDNKNINAI